MDNFTHSLAGWALGQAGLKRLSGLAVPTLIIAANLPDIDAVAAVMGVQSLPVRRGLTHGPVAMLVLPLLLTAAMLAYDRWQSRRRTQPPGRLPVRAGPLLLLAIIGTLSHPMLDYLNSYGIRLLEPFSSQWFYGDTLFIIDVWLWLILSLGVGLSRRRTKAGEGAAERPAQIALVCAVALTATNGWIARTAEAETMAALQRQTGRMPELVIANPVPVAFWRREMIWRDNDIIGWAGFDLLASQRLRFDTAAVAKPVAMQLVMQAERINPDAAAFLFWARVPYAQVQGNDPDQAIILRDARFSNPWVIDRFTVITPTKVTE